LAGAAGGPGVPWWNVLALLRAARRSPFYRAECRQPARFLPVLAGAGLAGLVFLVVGALGGFCCMFVPLAAMVLSVPATLLPAFLVAEGLLGEIEADTAEGLLLTAGDRTEVLWAKLAARLRGWRVVVFAAAAVCPAAGGLVGGMVGGEANDGEVLTGLLAGLAIGAASGALAGLLLAGQALTGGALATVMVLHWHRRAAGYAMVSLVTAGMTMAESVAWGVAGVVVLSVAMETGRGGGDAAWVAVALGLLAGAVLLALRVLVVNWLLPALLMRYAAENMDRLLLAGR